jgi:hypothetical protein
MTDRALLGGDTMKRIAILAVALGFLVGAQALAQTKEHTESTTKQSAPGPDLKSKTETVTGTVKEYEAGKKIKISGPNDKSYTFELDENAQVQGNIAIGQMAKVTYHKDTNGKERVTVLSEATGMPAMGSTGGSRMHSESEMKHKGPGMHTEKTKTEVVVGTVKEYEAGKKIKVTGPNDKDYTFDLDENVALKGGVSVGEKVKVTYTKGDNGDKVTTIMPVKSRS